MNILTHQDWDHPLLAKAREDGDPERLAALLGELRGRGELRLDRYELIDQFQQHNLIVTEGRQFALDLVTGVASNTGLAWYFGLFSSDSTPTEAWDGDCGAASGGDCTEFTGYDEATRQECEFTAAAANGSRISTTNTTRAVVTVSTGVDTNVYGVFVTNNSTKQYSGGAAKLLGAVRYPSARSYQAGQIKTLAYELYRV